MVKKMFHDHFMKKKNVIYNRAKFNMTRQEEGEPVDAIITALYNLVSKCDYVTLNDELIRDNCGEDKKLILSKRCNST